MIKITTNFPKKVFEYFTNCFVKVAKKNTMKMIMKSEIIFFNDEDKEVEKDNFDIFSLNERTMDGFNV